jgi:polyisoprenoid-binding protein YceI
MSTLAIPSTRTTWNLDPAHTTVEFAVKHLMITTVKGRFADVRGSLVTDDADPAAAVIDVEIGAASIDTRNEQRDAHLRSADFFDVETHPTLVFQGKRVEGDVTGDFRLIGDLTIRGVTREITLDVENEGTARDPWGGERSAFSAKGKFSRADFGLTWNQALEAGGVMVSDEVKVSIDAQFVKA